MNIIPEDKLFKDIGQSEQVHQPSRNSVLKVLRDNNFQTGVEIGIQYGQCSERLLDNGVVTKLYGIDPYQTDIGTITPLNDKVRDNEVYGFALGKLERFKDRYTHVKKTSNEALFDIDGLIDCIYIDGNTSKENTWDDISYWFPKLKGGGIMAGHNYGHSSFRHIKTIVDNYFGFEPKTEEGYIWWVGKRGTFNDTRKVSVVTPFYNASQYTSQLVTSLIEDQRVAEIIIVDDFSDNDEYVQMRHFATSIGKPEGYEKVKVFRNEENLGEFKTRIRGAEEATGDWVVFLDDDNYLSPKYLDSVYSIPQWREDVIYAPDYGNHIHIDYREYDGSYINKDNAKRFLSNPYLFKMFLNTGNYLMNRKKYLEVAKPVMDIPKHTYGDIFFNGEWFNKGYSVFTVPGMEYFHRIRKDSVWKEHSAEMQPVIDMVIDKLR